jgi:hypothetical protein
MIIYSSSSLSNLNYIPPPLDCLSSLKNLMESWQKDNSVCGRDKYVDLLKRPKKPKVAKELRMTSAIDPPVTLPRKTKLCLDLSKHQHMSTDPFKPPPLTLISILFSSPSVRSCSCPEIWTSQLDSLYLALEPLNFRRLQNGEKLVVAFCGMRIEHSN